MIVRTVRERACDATCLAHGLVHVAGVGVRHAANDVGACHLYVVISRPSILVAADVLVKYDVAVGLVRVFLQSTKHGYK